MNSEYGKKSPQDLKDQARRQMLMAEKAEPCVTVTESNWKALVAAQHTQIEMLKDATAHAEILSIGTAAGKLDNWRLDGCTLYVTLEPCCMCAGAIIQARIPLVVYGADDPKAGAVKSLFSLLNDSRLNHRCEVISGILDTACGKVLTDFFQKRRDEKKG